VLESEYGAIAGVHFGQGRLRRFTEHHPYEITNLEREHPVDIVVHIPVEVGSLVSEVFREVVDAEVRKAALVLEYMHPLSEVSLQDYFGKPIVYHFPQVFE